MKTKTLHRDINFILTHIVRPNELHQQTQRFLVFEIFFNKSKMYAYAYTDFTPYRQHSFIVVMDVLCFCGLYTCT